MKRTLLLVGGGVALVVLMFALSHTGSVPEAKASTPEPSTVSIDMVMCDGASANNPQPHCAMTDLDGDTVPDTAVGDDDGVIEQGENPEVQTNLWIDVDWTDASDEPGFDLTVMRWTTGAAGPDVTGDGWDDPLSGLAANKVTTLGAAVGKIEFKNQGNLEPLLALFNNVDDAPTNTDATVVGQPPVCNIDRLYFQDEFEMWAATTCLSDTVENRDTDGSKCADTQDDSVTGSCSLVNAPKGVVKSPKPLTQMLVGTGLPLSKYMERAFGIARLPIPPPPETPIFIFKMDVNFVTFNLVDAQQRYVQLNLVGYAVETAAAPQPGGELAQTVFTCAPFWSSPMRAYGVSVDPDFNEDGQATGPEVGLGGEPHRVAIADGGPFDYGLDKSASEDYDGDGIASPHDRCDTDPTCGTATDDPDGDFLCGTCDANGEGNGCSVGEPSPIIPWHACQDVDQDGRINQHDNCPTMSNPTHEDRDGDGVGDACDSDPDVPGPGANPPWGGSGGYASGFNDADNNCIDQFSIGLGEPAAEDGGPPSDVIGNEGKYCMGPASEVGLTTPGEPPAYVSGNPALHAIGANIQDASDDGVPDYLNVTGVGLLYDPDSDADLDGHSDGCEGFVGSDALDPSSMPGAPAVAGIPGMGGDCDGGGEWDYAEDVNGRDPFDNTDDSGTPHQGDSDADGCEDYEEIAGAAAPKPGATGNYNPLAPYDFYDVPIPARADPDINGDNDNDGLLDEDPVDGADNDGDTAVDEDPGDGRGRNQAVAMDDVLGVLFYVGTYDGDGGTPNANGVAYDSDKDGDTRKDGREYDRAPSAPPNPPWNASPPSGAIAMDDVLAVLAQSGLSCIGA